MVMEGLINLKILYLPLFMKTKNSCFLLCFFCLFSLSSQSQIISTIAGSGVAGYAGDGGTASNAQFNNPISLALDATGNIYISDFYNHRIRKMNIATNTITTVGGNGTPGFSGDGGPATSAQINNPGDLCVDAIGNIYFIDNQNFRIRKIEATTGLISTIAGNGGANYAGETIAAISAGIHYPNGVAVDANGNLYISLFTKQRICKIDMITGILSTIGGNGANGFSGDGGPAINASFGYPAGLSVTSAGDVFVADYNNNRIRKINAMGIVTTVVGNGTAGFSGDGSSAINASVNFPTGVFVDLNGNIFIADRGNNRIRKVTVSDGNINTVAGSGVFGYGGDGGSAISPCAKLADPHKIRVDAAGNLFIADQSNNRIRKVDTNPVTVIIPTINISSSSTTVCANTPVAFNATITNGGVNPIYKWKVNGIIVGTNSPTFTSSALNNGDIISCELTTNSNCGSMIVTSNNISISITASVIPAITISSNATAICSGSNVSFTSSVINEGSLPTYQWQINGTNTGNNNPSFSSGNLANGDVVSCIMTSSALCAVPSNIKSNNIIITVTPITTPSVTITASATDICLGSIVTFNAVAVNAGINPAYQWKINGLNVGNSMPAFSYSLLQDGDIITCSIVSDPTLKCATTNTANSNQIRIKVSASVSPSINIVASTNNICLGSVVTFNAIDLNGGNSPGYQWKVNGINTGSNNSVFSSTLLRNGDKVECVLIPKNALCPSLPVTSNAVLMTVYNLPVISIHPIDTIVVPGSQVQLIATVGGSYQSFQWSPSSQLIDPLNLAPRTFPLNTNTSFTLTVKSNEGCIDSSHAQIKIYIPFFMPTGFTPNNNGLNDIYRIPPSVQIALKRFSIYNIWGEIVFSTTDINKGWDGKYKGINCSSGVFVYLIEGNIDGKKVIKKNTFVLIR